MPTFRGGTVRTRDGKVDDESVTDRPDQRAAGTDARTATYLRRSVTIRAGAVIGALIAAGVAMAGAASGGSVWRDLGLAIVSGGIVGGVLVAVEAMLVSAAERRAGHEALMRSSRPRSNWMGSTSPTSTCPGSTSPVDRLSPPGSRTSCHAGSPG